MGKDSPTCRVALTAELALPLLQSELWFYFSGRQWCPAFVRRPTQKSTRKRRLNPVREFILDINELNSLYIIQERVRRIHPKPGLFIEPDLKINGNASNCASFLRLHRPRTINLRRYTYRCLTITQIHYNELLKFNLRTPYANTFCGHDRSLALAAKMMLK